MPLIAGHRYDIQMDFEQLSGGASSTLYWSSPNTPVQAIPQSALYTAYDAGATPTAAYTTAVTSDVGTWVQ